MIAFPCTANKTKVLCYLSAAAITLERRSPDFKLRAQTSAQLEREAWCWVFPEGCVWVPSASLTPPSPFLLSPSISKTQLADTNKGVPAPSKQRNAEGDRCHH